MGVAEKTEISIAHQKQCGRPATPACHQGRSSGVTIGTGLRPEHIPATPADITRTGGLGMESDYFWLVLLIGAAVLLMLVALERMYF